VPERPGSSEPRSIGTAREIADTELRRFREAYMTGRGHPLVVARKINDWLEYRFRHQQAGTLDVERFL
jgi:hypothetical protein